MPLRPPYRLKTITEYHRLRRLPPPEHPLLSIVHFDEAGVLPADGNKRWVFDFYSIALKRNLGSTVKYHYGQQTYDFDEGVLFFISPNQVFSVEAEADYRLSGWMLLVHPDFFRNSTLAGTIRRYDFFGYAAHEALHLSEKEEKSIIGVLQSIQQEYRSSIDKFSQPLIVAQIEVLLTYADRFYHRQFITRQHANLEILTRLEAILHRSFSGDPSRPPTIPSVGRIAEELNVSPNYLSGLLKNLTGQSTQQHIHDKLIERAKERLATSEWTVGEIAYQLGFEHPQSFSKLFKAKTRLSPTEYRKSFN